MTVNFESTDPIPMRLTEFDLDNIRGILAEPTRYDWFTAHVLRLCQKADEDNLRKIATIYPDCVAAFLIYHIGYIPDRFIDVIPDWEYYIKMMIPHIHGGYLTAQVYEEN